MELDEPPTLQETSKAINQLSSGKAPGTDAIPAEIYKTGGPMLTQKLTERFTSFWSKGSLPQDFKEIDRPATITGVSHCCPLQARS